MRTFNNMGQFVGHGGANNENRQETSLMNYFKTHRTIVMPDITNIMGYGCNMNEKDNNGDTPLHYACLQIPQQVLFDVIRIMIQKGAKIDTPNNFGATPVMIASGKGHNKIVELFVKKGVDINKQDKYGNSVVTYALNNKHEKLSMFLIDNGANLDVKDSEGRTSIDLAREKGLTEVIDYYNDKKFTGVQSKLSSEDDYIFSI